MTLRNLNLGLMARTAACALFLGAAGTASAAGTGNVIFIHPDGTALQHWTAARIYWEGPDGNLAWDLLPEMAVYRGHMSDQLTGTSNGGATTHAFGVKVQGPDSYGRDRGREILALSGYPGSIMREAAEAGHPVGVVNDGDINGEPGTGVFLAETDSRRQNDEQALQLIEGRPGFDDPDPDVIMGGGERFFLPEGTPRCTRGNVQLDCYVHIDPVDERADGEGASAPTRTDGKNLLQIAHAKGYRVVRTRQEFEDLRDELERRPRYAPKVLGLFSADDIFNDEEEEELIELGLVRNGGSLSRLPQTKLTSLLLWGDEEGTPGDNPPTAAEMAEVALIVLERRAEKAGKPFLVVVEVESTDNFPNKNNAQGSLRALKRADDTIDVARDFLHGRGAFKNDGDEETLILTAADSDGSGLNVFELRPVATDDPFNPIACLEPAEDSSRNVCLESGGTTTFTTVNEKFSTFEAIGDDIEAANARAFVDGEEGRESAVFEAEPDALQDFRPFPDEDEAGLGSFGGGTIPDQPLLFGVTWNSVEDQAGGILSRAEGLNAELLRDEFYQGFDNTDVYRMMYLTLFGEFLPSGVGLPAEDR